MNKRYLVLFITALFVASAVMTTMNASVVSALQTEIVSRYVDGDLPLADPDSPMWGQATPIDVPLSGQTVIAPKTPDPSVTSMRVRSLTNGSWVAFLLEWDDPTMDTGGSLTDFKDSAAIQFPSVQGQPFICMGDSRNSVEILHWRSDFQKDIEVGMPNASDVFPNMWVSIYPGGDDPAFLTGRGAGNPLSAANKSTPVEDLIAGGFGTLTSEPHNDAVGWAKWEGGKWKAVIGRPMITSDPDDAQFTVGMQTSLALAVWDGGKADINGKKSVSTWVTMRLEGPSAEVQRVTLPVSDRPLPAAPPLAETVIRTGLPPASIAVLAISMLALVALASWISWSVARRT